MFKSPLFKWINRLGWSGLCALMLVCGSLPALPAQACSVTATPPGGGPPPPPRDEQAILAKSVQAAEVVFAGRIISEMWDVSSPNPIVVQVVQYLKGQGPIQVVVNNFNPICPPDLVGWELIFLAYRTEQPQVFFVENNNFSEDKVSWESFTPINLTVIQATVGQEPVLPMVPIADYLPPATQPQPPLPLWALAGGLASGLVALAIWHQARSKKQRL